MTTTLKYISHNGTGIGMGDEEIDFIPKIGESIHNKALEDSGCTGIFVVVDVFYVRGGANTSCYVECIECDGADDKRFRLHESGNLDNA